MNKFSVKNLDQKIIDQRRETQEFFAEYVDESIYAVPGVEWVAIKTPLRDFTLENNKDVYYDFKSIGNDALKQFCFNVYSSRLNNTFVDEMMQLENNRASNLKYGKDLVNKWYNYLDSNLSINFDDLLTKVDDPTLEELLNDSKHQKIKPQLVLRSFKVLETDFSDYSEIVDQVYNEKSVKHLFVPPNEIIKSSFTIQEKFYNLFKHRRKSFIALISGNPINNVNSIFYDILVDSNALVLRTYTYTFDWNYKFLHYSPITKEYKLKGLDATSLSYGSAYFGYNYSYYFLPMTDVPMISSSDMYTIPNAKTLLTQHPEAKYGEINLSLESVRNKWYMEKVNEFDTTFFLTDLIDPALLTQVDKVFIQKSNMHKHLDETTYVSCYQLGLRFNSGVVGYVPIQIRFDSKTLQYQVSNLLESDKFLLHGLNPLLVEFIDSTWMVSQYPFSISDVHVDASTKIYWVDQTALSLSPDFTILTDSSKILFLNGMPIINTFTYSRKRFYDDAPVAVLDQWSQSTPQVKRTPFGAISTNFQTRFWDYVKFYGGNSKFLCNSLDPSLFGGIYLGCSITNLGSLLVGSEQNFDTPSLGYGRRQAYYNPAYKHVYYLYVPGYSYINLTSNWTLGYYDIHNASEYTTIHNALKGQFDNIDYYRVGNNGFLLIDSSSVSTKYWSINNSLVLLNIQKDFSANTNIYRGQNVPQFDIRSYDVTHIDLTNIIINNSFGDPIRYSYNTVNVNTDYTLQTDYLLKLDLTSTWISDLFYTLQSDSVIAAGENRLFHYDTFMGKIQGFDGTALLDHITDNAGITNGQIWYFNSRYLIVHNAPVYISISGGWATTFGAVIYDLENRTAKRLGTTTSNTVWVPCTINGNKIYLINKRYSGSGATKPWNLAIFDLDTSNWTDLPDIPNNYIGLAVTFAQLDDTKFVFIGPRDATSYNEHDEPYMVVYMSLVDGTQWIEDDAYYINDGTFMWKWYGTNDRYISSFYDTKTDRWLIQNFQNPIMYDSMGSIYSVVVDLSKRDQTVTYKRQPTFQITFDKEKYEYVTDSNNVYSMILAHGNLMAQRWPQDRMYIQLSKFDKINDNNEVVFEHDYIVKANYPSEYQVYDSYTFGWISRNYKDFLIHTRQQLALYSNRLSPSGVKYYGEENSYFWSNHLTIDQKYFGAVKYDNYYLLSYKTDTSKHTITKVSDKKHNTYAPLYKTPEVLDEIELDDVPLVYSSTLHPKKNELWLFGGSWIGRFDFDTTSINIDTYTNRKFDFHYAATDDALSTSFLGWTQNVYDFKKNRLYDIRYINRTSNEYGLQSCSGVVSHDDFVMFHYGYWSKDPEVWSLVYTNLVKPVPETFDKTTNEFIFPVQPNEKLVAKPIVHSNIYSSILSPRYWNPNTGMVWTTRDGNDWVLGAGRTFNRNPLDKLALYQYDLTADTTQWALVRDAKVNLEMAFNQRQLDITNLNTSVSGCNFNDGRNHLWATLSNDWTTDFVPTAFDYDGINLSITGNFITTMGFTLKWESADDLVSEDRESYRRFTTGSLDLGSYDRTDVETVVHLGTPNPSIDWSNIVHSAATRINDFVIHLDVTDSTGTVTEVVVQNVHSPLRWEMDKKLQWISHLSFDISNTPSIFVMFPYFDKIIEVSIPYMSDHTTFANLNATADKNWTSIMWHDTSSTAQVVHSWDVTGLTHAYPLAKWGDIWWFYQEAEKRLFSVNVSTNTVIDEKLSIEGLFKTSLDDSRFFIEFYENDLLWGGELSHDGTFFPIYLDKLPLDFYTDSTVSPQNVQVFQHEKTIDVVINDTTYQHIELVKRFSNPVVERLYENNDFYIILLKFYNYDAQSTDELFVYCSKNQSRYWFNGDTIDSTYKTLCYSIDQVFNYQQLLHKSLNSPLAEYQQETQVYWFASDPKFIVYYDEEIGVLRYIDPLTHLVYESDPVSVYDGLIFYENFEDNSLEHEYIFWNALHPTARQHNGLPIILFDLNRQLTRSGKIIGYNVPQLWDATSFKTSIVFPQFVKRVSLDFDIFWLSSWNTNLWDNTNVFSEDIYDSIDFSVDGYFPYIICALSKAQNKNLHEWNDLFLDLDLTFVDFTNTFVDGVFLTHPVINPMSSAYVNSDNAFVTSCKNGTATYQDILYGTSSYDGGAKTLISDESGRSLLSLDLENRSEFVVVPFSNAMYKDFYWKYGYLVQRDLYKLMHSRITGRISLKYNRYAWKFLSNSLVYPDFTPSDFSYFITDFTGYPFSWIVLHSDQQNLSPKITDVMDVPSEYSSSISNTGYLNIYAANVVLDYIDNSVAWNFWDHVVGYSATRGITEEQAKNGFTVSVYSLWPGVTMTFVMDGEYSASELRSYIFAYFLNYTSSRSYVNAFDYALTNVDSTTLQLTMTRSLTWTGSVVVSPIRILRKVDIPYEAPLGNLVSSNLEHLIIPDWLKTLQAYVLYSLSTGDFPFIFGPFASCDKIPKQLATFQNYTHDFTVVDVYQQESPPTVVQHATPTRKIKVVGKFHDTKKIGAIKVTSSEDTYLEHKITVTYKK